MRNFFSICIPTWEIRGNGVEYLEYSFNILSQQIFTDFDIIISDNSVDNNIKNLCLQWSTLLNIKYYKNENGRGFISPNLNNGLSKCEGQYIKILFQDDFLYGDKSLQILYDYINKNIGKKWFINGCGHTEDMMYIENIMIPRYHDKIHLGINTISCPSVLTIKNENIMLFDESLLWLMDVEYYKRCFINYGEPGIIDDMCIINREQPNRVSNNIALECIQKEKKQMELLYGN